MAIIVIFSASGAIAEEVSPPTTCDCFGFGIEVLTDGDGNFPVKDICTDPEDASKTVPCWRYEYKSSTGASAYAQTVPGLGPETFIVYLADSFSSITYSEPAVGTTISKACFGQSVHERAVVNFSSAPSGNPPKFGYAANTSGVGWTSLYFKQGKDFCSCAIAGPDFKDEPYIQRTILYKMFGDTKVRLEIDYQNCTYRAFDDESGDEYDQFPQEQIEITVGGVTGSIRENNSPGKCNELAYAFGTGTCSLYILGGYAIRIPYGCRP